MASPAKKLDVRDALTSFEHEMLALGRRAAKAAAVGVLPSSLLALRGPRRVRRVALTFDDGPAELTPAYLEVLSRYGVRATFFVVGMACMARRQELDRLARAGHELGGHGFTHRLFPDMNRRDLEFELRRTARLLAPHAGSTRLIRPPRGALSLSSLLVCANSGYRTILWSRDSLDWRTRDADQVVVETFARPIEPGEIILFHEGQPWTLEALPRVIERLLETGHELVTISDLLDG